MSYGRVVALIAAVALCVLEAGCFSYTAARGPGPRVGSGPHELPWPEPDPGVLVDLQRATPERVFRARLLPSTTLDQVGDASMRALVERPRLSVVRNEIIDGALVRMHRSDDGELDWSSLLTGFVPNGRVLSARQAAPAARSLAMSRDARVHQRLNAMWKSAGIEVDPTADLLALDDGVPIRVPETVPANCRGVILHLWALAGNEYERRVADVLAERGWFIIDVKPMTAAAAEVRADVVDRIIALEDEQAALGAKLPRMEQRESPESYQRRLRSSEAFRRHGELARQILELRNPPVQLCSADDVMPAAAELAARIDAVLIDNARAAGAALEVAYRMHPDLRGLPTVVIGFSAGALSTPTTAALIGPDAVIVIGGAANAVGVSIDSELTKGGIRINCQGKPAAASLVKKLSEAYLLLSKFDPYHAAPVLEGRPALVVDAGMDTWVPSRLGFVLYQRLGKPDRLHMALGGHGMLFYFLPRRAGWIADWLERSIPESRVKTQ